MSVETVETLVSAIVPIVLRALERERQLARPTERDAEWEARSPAMDGTAAVSFERIRSLWVESIPSGGLELEVVGSNGRVLPRMQLTPGLVIRGAYMHVARLIPDGTGASGDVATVFASPWDLPETPLPESTPAGVGLGDDNLGVEQVVEYVDTGAGNGSVDVELEPGFQYKMCYVAIRCVNDASAGSRRIGVSVRRSDGATEMHNLRHADDQAANETGYVLLSAGAGIASAARTLSTDSWDFFPLSWSGRIPSGQTNLAVLRVTVSGGFAGDAVTVVSQWVRRRIL